MENEQTQTETQKPEIESKESKATGVEQIANELVNEQPEVSAFVDEQEEKPEPDQGPDHSNLTDKYGRAFDPEIHVTNDDGSPRINKGDGHVTIKKWIKRPVTASKVKKPRPKSEKPEPKPEPKPFMPPGIAGKVAADITFTIGVAVGGREWAPMKNDEMGVDELSFMQDAYANYFEAMGITDVPPGWVLVIALSSYVAPRLVLPKTQTRFSRAYSWIKAKIRNRRIKRNGARSNNRGNGERENDISEKAGIQSEKKG